MSHLNLKHIFTGNFDYSNNRHISEVISELTNYITRYSSAKSHSKDVRGLFRDQGMILYQTCLDHEEIVPVQRSQLFLLSCQFFNIHANLPLRLVPDDPGWSQHLPKSTFKLNDSTSILLLKVYTRTIKAFIDACEYNPALDLFQKASVVFTQFSDTAIIHKKQPSIIFYLYFNAFLAFFENHQYDEALSMAKRAHVLVLEDNGEENVDERSIIPDKAAVHSAGSSIRQLHQTKGVPSVSSLKHKKIALINESTTLSNQLYNYTIELVHLRHFKTATAFAKLAMVCIVRQDNSVATVPSKPSVNRLEREMKLQRLLSICYFERGQYNKALAKINQAISFGESIVDAMPSSTTQEAARSGQTSLDQQHFLPDNAQNYYFRCKVLLSLHQQGLGVTDSMEDQPDSSASDSFDLLRSTLVEAMEKIHELRLSTALLACLPFNVSNALKYLALSKTCYHTVLTRHPHDSSYISHVYILWLVKHEQLEQAYHILTTVNVIHPDTLGVVWNVCVGLYEQEKYGDCSKWCQALGEVLPSGDIINTLMTHLAYSQAQFMLGNWTTTIRMCEEAFQTISQCEGTPVLGHQVLHEHQLSVENEASYSSQQQSLQEDSFENSDMVPYMTDLPASQQPPRPNTPHGSIPPTVEHQTRFQLFKIEATVQFIRACIAQKNHERAASMLDTLFQLKPDTDVLCLLCKESHTQGLVSIERLVLAWMVENGKHDESNAANDSLQDGYHKKDYQTHDPLQPIISHNKANDSITQKAIVIVLALLKLDVCVIMEGINKPDTAHSTTNSQRSDPSQDQIRTMAPDDRLNSGGKGLESTLDESVANIISVYADIKRFIGHLSYLCQPFKLGNIEPQLSIEMASQVVAFIVGMQQSTRQWVSEDSPEFTATNTAPASHGLLNHPTVEVLQQCDESIIDELEEAIKYCWNIALLSLAAHLYDSAHTVLLYLVCFHSTWLQISLAKGKLTSNEQLTNELFSICRNVLLIASCYHTIFVHPGNVESNPRAFNTKFEMALEDDSDPNRQKHHLVESYAQIPGYNHAVEENKMRQPPSECAQHLQHIIKMLHHIIGILKQFEPHTPQSSQQVNDRDVRFNSNKTPEVSMSMTASQLHGSQNESPDLPLESKIEYVSFLTVITEFRCSLYLNTGALILVSSLPQRLSLASLDLLAAEAIQADRADVATLLLQRRVETSVVGEDTPLTLLITLTREMLLLESDHRQCMTYISNLIVRTTEYYATLEHSSSAEASAERVYHELKECKSCRALCILAYNQAIYEFNIQQIQLAKDYLQKVIELRRLIVIVPYNKIRKADLKSAKIQSHRDMADDDSDPQSSIMDEDIENTDDYQAIGSSTGMKLTLQKSDGIDPYPQEGKVITKAYEQIQMLSS